MAHTKGKRKIVTDTGGGIFKSQRMLVTSSCEDHWLVKIHCLRWEGRAATLQLANLQMSQLGAASSHLAEFSTVLKPALSSLHLVKLREGYDHLTWLKCVLEQIICKMFKDALKPGKVVINFPWHNQMKKQTEWLGALVLNSTQCDAAPSFDTPAASTLLD